MVTEDVVFGARQFDFGQSDPDVDELQDREERSKKQTEEEKLEEKEKLLQWLRTQIIGEDKPFETPYGSKRIVYCDYTASGRALQFIEDYIKDEVLPFYGNTHTTTSITGRQSTFYRHEARQLIKQELGGNEEDVLLFCGTGSTAAIHKLIHAMNLHQAAPQSILVLIASYEHHSNILPWREIGATVIFVQEHPVTGAIDLHHLEQLLKDNSHYPIKIGSFSAASNVSGIISDHVTITKLLHNYNALSFWDFATAAPYIDVQMNPIQTVEGEPSAVKDAVFVSPHKFIGGVSCPGLLLAKRTLFKRVTPQECGGGTVFFVTESQHVYLSSIEEREEAGTPDIVGAIRCGLVFQLKQALSASFIEQKEKHFVTQAMEKLRDAHPQMLHILGSHETSRLPILSFVVEHPESKLYLHHNYVCAVLNDVFGIQSRGGCVCAGPYAQYLLGIDSELAQRYQNILLRLSTHSLELQSILPRERDRQGTGSELLRPGFVRLNFHYTLDDDTFEFIIKAILWVTEHAWKLLPLYKFNIQTGEWSHSTFSQNRTRFWLGANRFFPSFSSSEPGFHYPQQQQRNKSSSNETTLITRKQYFEHTLSAANSLLDSQSLKSMAKSLHQAQVLSFDEEQKALRWFLLPSEAKHFLLQSLHEPTSHLSAVSPAPFSIRKYGLTNKEESIINENKKNEEEEDELLDLGFGGDEDDDEPVSSTSNVKFHIPSKAIIHSGIEAIEEFDMIHHGDRVIVCVSGGKDSLTMLHLLKHYQFICKSKGILFDIAAATVDPQTPSTFDPSPLKGYMKALGVPYFYLSEAIMESAREADCKSICSYCSRMKRGMLYTCARKEGYNVLALGQHLDDLAESFLMSVFHNGLLRTMKANYTITEGDLRIIRPLVCTRERLLAEFAAEKKLPVIAENCPACFVEPKERHRIKQLLATQESLHKNVFHSIQKSIKPLMAINKTGQEVGTLGYLEKLQEEQGEEKSILDL